MKKDYIEHFVDGREFDAIDLEDALAFPGSFVPFPNNRTLLIKEWTATADGTGLMEIKLSAYVFGKQTKGPQP